MADQFAGTRGKRDEDVERAIADTNACAVQLEPASPRIEPKRAKLNDWLVAGVA